jgi:hypothetical protein
MVKTYKEELQTKFSEMKEDAIEKYEDAKFQYRIKRSKT